MRSSEPSVVADGARACRRVLRGLGLALLLAAATMTPAVARQPVLPVGGAGTGSVVGISVNGTSAFPASALGSLGFSLASSESGLAAALGGDTIRFWTTSPFIRAGAAVYQLAFPVSRVDGETFLPEQFFIQWLPSRFPDRFAFRAGALEVLGAVAAAPAPSASAPAGSVARQAARVVIIDPGHGGRDPGKVGPNGLRESDVVLLIGQRLAAVLRDRGYEVHMTRDSDTFVPLAERTRLANEWQADRPGTVLLSIHANSFESAGVRGFETFFLSEARTEDERRVAEMENAVVRFEENPRRPSGSDLDRVLVNLRSEYLTRASHDLAAIMQQRMAAFHPGPNRGVKRAPFFVLVGAVMPAVLVETAFISNREEANLLGSQAFQQSLAWGLADGVDEFFGRNEHLWTQAR
ncbi:MAG TPA: N-acetylmuramoyl-L-alanine amidase [Longimicrobiales bacterium]|nr:N-acetylmuramoyl-L-alanine amidase [Longimicrobiales bacterium]